MVKRLRSAFWETSGLGLVVSVRPRHGGLGGVTRGSRRCFSAGGAAVCAAEIGAAGWLPSRASNRPRIGRARRMGATLPGARHGTRSRLVRDAIAPGLFSRIGELENAHAGLGPIDDQPALASDCDLFDVLTDRSGRIRSHWIPNRRGDCRRCVSRLASSRSNVSQDAAWWRRSRRFPAIGQPIPKNFWRGGRVVGQSL